jgi:hypothetical protein
MVKGKFQYPKVEAFADAGERAFRIKKRIQKKKDKSWFAKKRAALAKQEREVFVEAKHADEDCLKTIAVSVAMFCLTVD